MATYFEIHVPLYKNALWFNTLKEVLKDYPVKWQDDFFHITIAFITENPTNEILIPIFKKHIATSKAPQITFDKIDVFTGSKEHIINLTSSVIPNTFISSTESIRKDLKEVGCIIERDFRLHVTLGRLSSSIVDLYTLNNLIEKVEMPSFSLILTDVEFREYHGKSIFKNKLLKPFPPIGTLNK